MPATKPAKHVRLACATALLTFSGQALALLPTDFSSPGDLDNYVEALPAATPPNPSVDWFDGKDHTPYAIAVSSWYIDRYYDESRARYSAMPPDAGLLGAKAGWLLYLLSLTGADKFTGNPPDHGWGWTITQPEIPLVNREVTNINHVTGFRRPHLPPQRWTRDGRVGVVADTGGVDGKPQPLRIALNRPEVLTGNFVDSAPGVPTMDPETWEIADYRA